MPNTLLHRLALSLAGLAAIAVPAHADPFSITPDVVASSMVSALLNPDSGITLVGTPRYNGADDGSSAASGTFTGGTGILPFDDGVILTTGMSATDAAGPNTSPGGFTGGVGSGGDDDLTALAGADTFDRAVIEFDFTATGDTLSLQYVFGSEEYDDFAGFGPSDLFAIYLNGENIATLPGTSSPVSPTTVNCGTNHVFYTGNQEFGGGAFGSCQNANLNTQYDGLVGVSMALLADGALLPGTNTLKIAIADVNDGDWDAGLFLKGGSLMAYTASVGSSDPGGDVPVVPEPGTLALIGSGLLFGARGVRRRFHP